MSSFKHILLYLSLFLNGLLVAAMIYRGTFSSTLGMDPQVDESIASGPAVQAVAASNVRIDRSQPSAADTPSPGSVDLQSAGQPSGSFHWKQVQTEDSREFIANLKALGVPNQTIAMIIMADLQSDVMEAMQRAVSEDSGAYWKQPDYSFAMDPELQLSMMELQRNADQLLREELGGDYLGAMGAGGPWMERQYGFLSAEKRQEIMTLDQDFSVLQQYVHQRAQGYMLPEDQEELVRLEAEKRAELESLLTPDELFEYDLRNSNLSHHMRHQLRLMDMSEEEFRRIYVLRQSQEGGAASSPGLPPQPVSAGSQGDINEQLMDVLGAERFREYELSQNHEYQQLLQLTNRLDLPRDRAIEMVELKEVVEQHQRDIQSDSSLSSEERREALRLLAEEVSAQGREALGESGFEVYRQRGGWWIQNLEQFRIPVAPVPTTADIPFP